MKEFVPLVLPILILYAVTPVLDACGNSCHPASYTYRKSRKDKYGPDLCALDTANKTIRYPSAAVELCSASCGRDATCTGFNIKDSHTCELYNYNPTTIMLVSSCVFYEVL